MYIAIKHIHMLAALVSVVGFALRGALKIRQSSLIERTWVRITPHIVDTILLVSALYLLISSQMWPTQHPWVAAKITALFVYIGLGLMTMRFSQTQKQRLIAYFMTLLCGIYIISVAISKQVLPGLG